MYKEISSRTGIMVYYTRKGTQCARRYFVPANPATPGQKANRRRFAAASQSWRNLDAGTKDGYNRKAANLNLKMSGFNLYVKMYIKAPGNSHHNAGITLQSNIRLLNNPGRKEFFASQTVPLRICFGIASDMERGVSGKWITMVSHVFSVMSG